jgi:hypothetical protein
MKEKESIEDKRKREQRAKAYMGIFLDQAEILKATPWWKLRQVERIRSKMRWAMYHFNKHNKK